MRAASERLAIFVPTWEIETWVLWLTGAQVDESISYKGSLNSDTFREKLPKAISAWSTPRADETKKVPSLAHGREELKRLRDG